MSLKDIEKLREKVDKDPNSKLFVPLAEEYRKEGMLDEAIEVLLKGIELQPAYMSARVSLGKIYVEKGQLPEARSEFENVIKSIPDNLYAHKKLAEIYRDTGQRDMAVNAYRTVLRLNAMDEDAQTNLRDLEGEEDALELEPEEELLLEAEPETEEPGYGELPGAEEHTAPFREQPSGTTLSDEELSAFKDSLFGDAAKTEEAEKAPAEEEAVTLEEEVDSFGNMEETDEGAISFGDINDACEVEETPLVSKTPVVESAPLPSAGKTAPEQAVFAELQSSPGEQASRPAGFEEADRFVAAGDYFGAINIYRRMLAADPGDKKTLQRAEELKTLLKLMGKDKEALMEKLNSFLSGINKRRDEFYGSS